MQANCIKPTDKGWRGWMGAKANIKAEKVGRLQRELICK